jgi:UDP:flavonoid glycosyltransferase YjiC (YdhE family)
LRAKVRTAIASRDGAIRIAGAYRVAGGPEAAAELCERQLRHASVTENSG